MDTIQNIEKIEKLVSKLKLVYTLKPCKQEEELTKNILDILEQNLCYFDENGKLIE
jgi:hypothetical protein